MRHGPALLAIAWVATACGGLARDDDSVEVERATMAPVVGDVRFREGNCMPGPSSCSVRPITVRILAYDVIAVRDGLAAPPDTARLAAETVSGADGRFSFELPEGRYTILAEYEGRFAPAPMSDGEWNPVEVNAGWLEEVELVMNRASD